MDAEPVAIGPYCRFEVTGLPSGESPRSCGQFAFEALPRIQMSRCRNVRGFSRTLRLFPSRCERRVPVTLARIPAGLPRRGRSDEGHSEVRAVAPRSDRCGANHKEQQHNRLQKHTRIERTRRESGGRLADRPSCALVASCAWWFRPWSGEQGDGECLAKCSPEPSHRGAVHDLQSRRASYGSASGCHTTGPPLDQRLHAHAQSCASSPARPFEEGRGIRIAQPPTQFRDHEMRHA